MSMSMWRLSLLLRLCLLSFLVVFSFYLLSINYRPNIPLSATSPQSIPHLNEHTAYVPPHPQRGSPYHRYVCLLLPQPALAPEGYTRVGSALAARQGNVHPTSQRLDIPVVKEEERRGFDVRTFMDRWGFEGRRGGGAHMFRQVWDEDVSGIYKDVLSEWFLFFGLGTGFFLTVARV